MNQAKRTTRLLMHKGLDLFKQVIVGTTWELMEMTPTIYW
jgi:hypothetical protein